MKKLMPLLIISIFFIFNFEANSQVDSICRMQDSYSYDFLESGNCIPDHNGSWSIFSDMNTYIPYLDPSYPLQNPSIKTIQVNINIIQKDDSSGNYPNNQTTIDRMRTIIGWVNSFYSSYSPSDPISWVNELPGYDSRIRFSIGEPGNERVYFYPNTLAWNNMFPWETIEPYIQQNYPERLEQLNVYIFGNPNNNNWAHASMPSNTDFNKRSWVVLFCWDSGGDWSKSGTLAHEFGHNLNLLHTYDGGGASAICNQQHKDFLQDVFIIEQPDISNCPHTCAWSADPFIFNGDGITNNLLGGNQHSTYISPMQAGQMHRSLAISSVRKYVKCEKSLIPLTIDGAHLWDFNLKLYRDLIINSGAKLTISCKLVIHPDAKIIVKPGGILEIDGGVITTDIYEKTPWQGIEVWGEKNKSQIPLPGQLNAQGKVILKNGAVIENAENAITLWKKNDYSSTGGIVQADDAVFINNRRSVEFMSYQNTHPISETPLGNISYFRNCRFEVNDEYLAPAPFFAHISMWEVDGINIQSCDFINNMTNEPNTGVGILTSNAYFDILPSCSSLVTPCPENNIVPNTFQGFKYGIESFGTGANIKTIYIKNAEFNGNSCGIKLSAVNNATIIHSKFNVGTNLQGEEECSFLYGVGIELLNCKSWAIEENEFEGGYGVPGTDYIGIRVFGDDNFNTGNNIIYRNQFTQLGRANLADGKNMDNNNPYYGLSYFCNTNSNNNYDFYVEPSPYGIAVYQGLPSKPAGNTFSKHSSPPGSDFTNLADWPVVYWYYNNEAIQQPENIIGVYPAGTSAQNSCLSNYGSETGYIEKRMLTETEKSYYEQLFEDSETSLKSVKALYASFVDGGSTEALQTEIELSGPQNMWELRAELLSKSPHLSKEVLISASNKTDVLPDQVIFEVLAANPDELRKEELIEYLETKADPLPQYMIEILRGLAANVTYKTVLQSLITSYETSKADAINTLLRDMINDNTATLSAVRSLMGAIQSLPMDYQIVESYMQEGNITDALAMANMLPQLYNISGEALEEHNRYMTFKQMRGNLINDGRNIFQLSETEKELLENLAEESNGISGMYAKNILSFVYNATFCNCPSPPADNLKRKPVANPTLIHKVYEPEISAKPNPAKVWVNFSYKLSSENPQAILEINDAQGRLIHSMQLNETEGRYVWDIRNITSGVYYYTLKSEKSAKSGKLIILH